MYQKIVMTRWKDDYWLFINGQEQFSTFDEEKYHEPLVHPAMMLSANVNHVLILGGGDGLALREVLKHPEVEKIILVDMDPEMTNLAKRHPVMLSVNNGSMLHAKVQIVNQDAARFLRDDANLYGVIIIDLPDPDSVDLMHVYSIGFYRQLKKHLIRGGVFVTQATSPYFSKQAFQCLLKTIGEAGFSTLPYHNHIPTMGEWGWIIGGKAEETRPDALKERLLKLDFSQLDTRYVNNEAVISMVHFGKGILNDQEIMDIKVNTALNPVLYRYYQKGEWDMY
jgi:spermidine synthase